MDHLAGIAYYLSQRYFQGMKPGTVLALTSSDSADPNHRVLTDNLARLKAEHPGFQALVAYEHAPADA